MLDKNLLNLLEKDKKKLFIITLLQLTNLALSLVIYASIVYSLYSIIDLKRYNISVLLLIILCCVLLKVSLEAIIGSLQSKIGAKVQTDLRVKLFSKILAKKGDFKKYNQQALSQLGLEGIEQLSLYYTVYVPQFFYSMISPILLFILFCFIAYPAAIVFLFCVPLIPVSIIAVSKYAKKIFAIYWDKYLSMGGDFLDNIRGMRELKIFLSDLRQQEKMDDNAEEFRKITMKVLVMQLWSTSIMDFVCFGGAAIGMVAAIISLQHGIVASPYLALFIIIVGAEFFLPMRALGSAFHISMNGATAGKKILDILNEEQEVNDKKTISNIDEIRIENANIAYDDEIILKDVNLKINENGLYSIVGRSGSGKSTIIKVLSRDLPLKSGIFTTNGIENNLIDDESYYKRSAFVSYQSHLFAKTVYENFLIVNPYATKEEMLKALQKVNLWDFSLDYQLLENANNISGGQKQRFILAFYLTLDKDLYVFDEVTSNIDSDSEEIIMNIIYELSKNKKVLMISHRLKNVIPSKVIYFINKGLIESVDTHDNLVLNNPNYKAIFDVQNELEGVILCKDSN